jgi:hypothetical protein
MWIDYTLNYQTLLSGLVIAFFVDLYLSLLLHWRYSSQFGLGFVMAGLVVFSLPTFFAVTLPVYILWETDLEATKKAALFCALAFVYLFAARRLTRKLLSKRFVKGQSAHNAAASPPN